MIAQESCFILHFPVFIAVRPESNGETMQMNRTVDGAARMDDCFIAMDDNDQAKLEHVFHSLDIRHAATGCVRDCSSLLGQLRIRSALANHRTSNIDLAVFRKFIVSIVAASRCWKTGLWL